MKNYLLVALLCLCTSLAAFAHDHATDDLSPQIVRIAELRETSIDLGDSYERNKKASGASEATISSPGASFIKVHFKHFNVPRGYVVEVSNPDGSEVYRYRKFVRDEFTVNAEMDEDGITSFASMSITGDTAVVRLINMVGRKNAWNSKVNGVYIAEYMEGYPNDVIEEIFGEPLYDKRGDLIQESTCGVNERTDVKCWENNYPTEYERARSVGRLVMGGGLCTAWRVGDNNHVMTNNHCMATASDVASSETWFNYQNTSCGGSTLDTIVKVSGNTMYKTDYNLDYTLYSVNSFNSISSFGNLGLDVRTPVAGEEIYIPQHGSGNPKELAIESDQNAGGLCQIDVAIADGRATNSDTGYYCDTIGGSSGSPVLARSSHKVIALHHFGGCTNQGVRIDLIWPQISTYFNNQIPDGSGGTPPTGNTPPSANFSYSTNELTANFTDSSNDADGSIASRSWNFGDGNTSTATNPSHTYNGAGTYNVTLTVTDNEGATNSKSASVTVSSSTGNMLTNGVPVSGLGATSGNWVHYRIDVPANASNLVFTTSGSNGDADLYTRFGAEPTTSAWDCRPYSAGSNETCEVASPQAGTYYVSVRAYSTFSNLTLTASYDEVTDPGTGTGGDTHSNLSGSSGTWRHYSITVPAGKTLTVTMSGGSGDADLYTRKGAEPTTSAYDCRPYKYGNSESCTHNTTAQDTWYISIRAYSTYSGVTLEYNYQ